MEGFLVFKTAASVSFSEALRDHAIHQLIKRHILVFDSHKPRDRGLKELMRPAHLAENHAEAYFVVPWSENLPEFGHVSVFEIAGNLKHRLCEDSQTSCHAGISDLV